MKATSSEETRTSLRWLNHSARPVADSEGRSLSMRKKLFLSCVAASLAFLAPLTSHAQARAAGVRTADLQIGGGYSFTASSDYSPQTYKGPYIYATYDFRSHWGVDLAFHQATSPSPEHEYERSYEVGPRYVFRLQHFNPYIRATYGRFVMNYPYNIANIAFNMYGLGGGVDIPVHKHINVRADFDHQTVISFEKATGAETGSQLTPNLISIGAAYHF